MLEKIPQKYGVSATIRGTLYGRVSVPVILVIAGPVLIDLLGRQQKLDTDIFELTSAELGKW